MALTNRPFRNGRAILGFLLKGEVDAIFKQQPFELKDEKNDPARAWRASFEATRMLEATPTSAEIGFLDETQLPILKTIRSRKTFAKYYDAIDDHNFAMVPIGALLAPQWLADLDYIHELASQITENASLEELIRFTMAEGTTTEPIISGTQVLFTSLRPDVYADQIPAVREVGAGEFEIVVRASSRPNYVSVASIGGRLLLTNGVHHVCALALRGFESVPCVLRSVGRIEETGLNLQSTIFRPDLLSGNRPAQVLDFLKDKVAVPLRMRSVYHVLRIGIGIESLRIPAIPDAGAALKPDASTFVPPSLALTAATANAGSQNV